MYIEIGVNSLTVQKYGKSIDCVQCHFEYILVSTDIRGVMQIG